MDEGRGEDFGQASALVAALQRVRDQDKKPTVRSTDYFVSLQPQASEPSSVVVQEQADVEDNEPDRSSTAVQRGPMTLTSWKTQEFAYRKTTKVGLRDDDELPTLARGLFTMPVSQPTADARQKQYRIVVRGYDKFFNEGEMPWTKPDAIAAYSCPPYELSFKENGCIIFISPLSPSQLIVTSKHSLGSNESHAVSHAQKGEEWLDTHLKSKGKDKAALAAELWRRNETAVAELCDDSFEEHVLAYPDERSGLHLHGLNANSVHFRTRSMADVETFASDWGFLPTRFITIDSLADVHNFCKSVGETGSWQGVAIEGFVVRTRMPKTIADKTDNLSTKLVAPPYQPGQTWFYKVKFDEPYLMFRDWRELTRRMLGDKEKFDKAREQRGVEKNAGLDVVREQKALTDASASGEVWKGKSAKMREAKRAEQARKEAAAAAGLSPPPPPQSRSSRAETKLFIRWCYEKLYGSRDGRRKPDLVMFDGFGNNKGIIRLRQAFVAYMQTSDGREELRSISSQSWRPAPGNDGGVARTMRADRNAITLAAARPQQFDKTLLVPIAAPGCGKTRLAVALSGLLPGLGHTQSDDVLTKRTAATFLSNVLAELDRHSVVFADRNNHLYKHRNEIADSVRAWEKKKLAPERGVRLVALAWTLDALPLNAIHQLCSERIVQRGDNHQSIRVSDKETDYNKILWRFLRQMQPFGSAEPGGGDQGHGDCAFDVVIRMNVNASLERNVTSVYGQLAPLLRLPDLLPGQLEAAVRRAMQYTVSLKKVAKPTAPPAVRYYGLAVHFDLAHSLPVLLQPYPSALAAFAVLHSAGRVTVEPHVTLIHSVEMKQRTAEEQGAMQVIGQAKQRWETYAHLASLSSAADFQLSIDRVAWDDKAMALGVCEVHSSALPQLLDLQGTRWRPHVTVGTKAEDVKAFEADRVLRDADAGSDAVNSVRLAQPLTLRARLKGMW